MASPPGSTVPWRLLAQNLRAAMFHGHLEKGAVMLKVYRKTGLRENKGNDSLS